jgi:alkylresorcinol/alkylpyrone synthase
MKIAGVGSALPEHHYEQPLLTRYLKGVFGEDLAPVIDRLHANTQVHQRHLALPLEDYTGITDFTAGNIAYKRCAVDLGERAIRDALSAAGLEVRDIDVLITATVTGVISPSLDALLHNRMGLRPDVKRMPLFGLGCVAGAAGVSRAVDIARGQDDAVVVVLTLELCSLTLQASDRSMANLISTGLFGDGASAAVVVGKRRTTGGPEVLATRSVFYPDTEDVMGWQIGAHGFRIILSADVPVVARERLPQDIDAFLGDHGLSRRDIQSWVCHPGGPKVLQALQDGLELQKGDLQCSWDHLAQAGNLSSASVLCILQDTIQERRPTPGSLGVMMAMGPGFCSELLLLKW